MFKLVILGKRRAGMTSAEFKEYYETIHAPLAWTLYPQMKRYVRTYFEPVEHEVYEGGKYPNGEPPTDCITEVWFESREVFQSVLANMMADTEKAALLAEDEAKLFDVSTIWRLESEVFE